MCAAENKQNCGPIKQQRKTLVDFCYVGETNNTLAKTNNAVVRFKTAGLCFSVDMEVYESKEGEP